MKRFRERLSLSAVALAATPIAIFNLGGIGEIGMTFAALTALFAGMVFSLTAVEAIREWY